MNAPQRALAGTAGSPRRLGFVLGATALLLIGLGMAAGSEGWSLAWARDWDLIEAIRLPRTLGAFLAGAALGLAGALAQGLFRNPLADPYLLGGAAGAGFGVVLVIFAGSLAGAGAGLDSASWLLHLSLVAAAFFGALGGVGLTLVLAGGAGRPMVLLLAGVVVGVVLGAATNLMMLLSPQALRGHQAFLLGTTGLMGWSSVGTLGLALVVAMPLAVRYGAVLDALVLGEASATSLGLDLPRLRLLLVVLMVLATGTAVSQAGLIAFVGLVAPHLVRRMALLRHGALLGLSALAGGDLLLAADVAARSLIAPQELPVGVLTALLGGIYLFVLLRRQVPDKHG